MNQREKAMMEAAKTRLEKAKVAYEAAQHSDDPDVVRRELPVAEHELKSAQRDWARYEAPAKEVVPVAAVPQAVMDLSDKVAARRNVVDIVSQTAKELGGRKFLQVEAWQAIASAHNCFASIESVTKEPDGGYSAVAVIKEATTGMELTRAEGYVGPDEPVWFGGVIRGRKLPKRADFAIRAMAQTRAISRACRSAFAYVVVMINNAHKTNFATTPAEEMVPDDAVEGDVEPESKWAAEIDEMCRMYGADPAKVWDWLGQQSHDRYSVTEKTANAVGDRLRRKAAKEKEAAA